jgi:hypothetical protein
MITKMISLHSLEEVVAAKNYIRDPNDPRHLHVTLGEQTVLGLNGLDEQEFFTLEADEMAMENEVVRRGPQRTVLAYHGITRNAPVKSAAQIVTETEQRLVPVRVHEMLEAKLIGQTHLHPTGDVDWHFLLFRRWKRKPSPGKLFRQVMDNILGEINGLRARNQRPLLMTVEDRRVQRLAYKGCDPLAMQLAVWGATTAQNLPEALTELGHRLGPVGIDEKTNTVHIVHPQADAVRVYPYNLGRLLEDARKAREYLETSDAMPMELDTSEMDI